jgi:hypothetical protein
MAGAVWFVVRALFTACSLPFVEVMDQVNPELGQRLKGDGVEISARRWLIFCRKDACCT